MLAAGKPDAPGGWMIVAREIALLASELGRVHRARGELDRAQQIETELSAELTEIHAALERGRTPPARGMTPKDRRPGRVREPLPPPARDPGQQVAPERRRGR
jgi:hypothetical protein